MRLTPGSPRLIQDCPSSGSLRITGDVSRLSCTGAVQEKGVPTAAPQADASATTQHLARSHRRALGAAKGEAHATDHEQLPLPIRVAQVCARLKEGPRTAQDAELAWPRP